MTMTIAHINSSEPPSPRRLDAPRPDTDSSESFHPRTTH